MPGKYNFVVYVCCASYWCCLLYLKNTKSYPELNFDQIQNEAEKKRTETTRANIELLLTRSVLCSFEGIIPKAILCM